MQSSFTPLRRKFFILPLILLALSAQAADVLWPSLSTPPASTGGSEKDAALLVGIEDYLDPTMQDIPGAKQNILDWQGYLTKTRKLPAGQLKILLNGAAIKESILEEAQRLSQVAKGKEGHLWVVFIGHGAPSRDGKDGLLVGADAQQTAVSMEARGLKHSELEAAISGVSTVMVLDTCFSGKSNSGASLAPGLQPVIPMYALLGASTVLTAAKGNQFAGPLPGGDRPAFSYLLLGALRGWGDSNGDGSVTTEEAYAWSSDALNATVTGRTQSPELQGDGSLVIGKGKEPGPDLADIQQRLAGEGRSVEVLKVPPEAGPDFAALAAQAAEADRQAEALRAQVESARRQKLDSGKSALQAQATKNWASLGPALSTGGNSSIELVQDFVAAYKGKSVTVDGVTEAVAIPEVAKAEAWLATKSGSGSDRQSPTLGTMKWIPAGTFMMGSSTSEYDHQPDETQHKVKLTNGFFMMEHEVTQGEWQTVMRSNPSRFPACGSTCPVEQVSWDDIQVFIQKVSARDHVQYRLPTEAEWEYAARGGQSFVYSGSESLRAVGWYDENSDNTTHPVCQKQRNAYGLCDMSGNVWEWVSDGYGDYSTSENNYWELSIEDPQGNASGFYRVLRGGGWTNSPGGARVTNRNGDTPSRHHDALGFRLSRTIP